MASRKKKVAQKLKNPMLPFESLSRDKPMPVTARRERPPKPLGSTCGAGVREEGGLGGSAQRGARTGHAGPRWRTGGPRPRWDHVGAGMGISGLVA